MALRLRAVLVRPRHLWTSSKRTPLSVATGIALLYSSAFFLPNLSTDAYFLPSRDIFGLVVIPTLIAVLIILIGFYVLEAVACTLLSARIVSMLAVPSLATIILIAIKSTFFAADYNWEYVIPSGHNMLSSLRYVKDIAFIVALIAVWMQRRRLPRLTRLLSSMGMAFGVLGLYKLAILLSTTQLPSSQLPVAATAIGAKSTVENSAAGGNKSRRAVWIIFDETDFARAFSAQPPLSLPNLMELRKIAVFATHASSPASDTLYSIPALLTGRTIGRSGVHIERGALWVELPDGTRVAFSQNTSVFGAVDSLGGSSSILGFYHPYCRLFALTRCDSVGGPYIKTWDVGLRANLPDSLVERPDWEEMTRKSIRLLPEYLARNDALTFIHLNFPHPPSDYADKVLGLSASADPIVEYSHNLLLMDQVIGQIMTIMQQQADRHELLLVISTDHWLRNMWYQADVGEMSRLIPFIAWEVGQTQGYVLKEPINTVNTEAMILDYLKGGLPTQEDIATWWMNRPAPPSFIRPMHHNH